MSSMGMLKFALNSAIDTPLNLLFALLAGLAGFCVVWFFKWSINKKWSGGIVPSGVAAISAAIGATCYLGMENADFYIQKKETEQKLELREDPVWRSDALSRTWNEVVDDEHSDNYDRIEDGGTWLPVSEAVDLSMYAQQAAQVLEDKLRLDDGTPHNVYFSSKEDVMKTVLAGGKSIQIFDSLESLEPSSSSVDIVKLLQQDNPIADLVMEHRVDELYQVISEGIDSEKARTVKFIILGTLMFILAPSLFACAGAWKDLVSTK